MILHENRLPADDSHEISFLICYFWKSVKIRNCHLLQIIGGALRVDILQVTKVMIHPWSSFQKLPSDWQKKIEHYCVNSKKYSPKFSKYHGTMFCNCLTVDTWVDVFVSIHLPVRVTNGSTVLKSILNVAKQVINSWSLTARTLPCKNMDFVPFTTWLFIAYDTDSFLR